MITAVGLTDIDRYGRRQNCNTKQCNFA